MGDAVGSLTRLSYSQFGEDRIAEALMMLCFNKDYPWNYLEIGTNHPIARNNTYLAYINGSRGVLVEPNPYFCGLIAKLRTGDKFYNCGVSFDGSSEATYYDFGASSGVNTFSEEVKNYRLRMNPELKVERELKLPLRDVNELLQENYPNGDLDLLSVDAEGYDLEIVKLVDFSRFRPKVIIAEIGGNTINSDDYNSNINMWLARKNYALASTTSVNNLYIDNSALVNKSFVPLQQKMIRSRNIELVRPEPIVKCGPNVAAAIQGGVSHPESWGVWTEHSIYESSIITSEFINNLFASQTGYKDRSVVTLKINFCARGISRQNVILKIGQREILFTLGTDFEKYSFTIEGFTGKESLVFTPTSPVSPLAPQMEDKRKLGIAISELSFSYV